MRTGVGAARARLLAELADGEPREVRDVLGRVRRVFKEGLRRGSSESRAHREAAALRDARTADGGAGRHARGLRRAHEDGAGGNLLRDCRTASRRRATARTSRSSAARAWKCCCSRDRVDEWLVGTCANSRASAAQRSRAASWTSGGQSGEDKQQRKRRDRKSAGARRAHQEGIEERVSDVRVTHRLDRFAGVPGARRA